MGLSNDLLVMRLTRANRSQERQETDMKAVFSTVVEQEVTREQWHQALSETGLDPALWDFYEHGGIRPEPPKPEKQKKTVKKKSKSGEGNKERAENHFKPLEGLLRFYEGERYTLQEMADRLNRGGFRTQRGKLFQRTQVHRLLKRL